MEVKCFFKIARVNPKSPASCFWTVCRLFSATSYLGINGWVWPDTSFPCCCAQPLRRPCLGMERDWQETKKKPGLLGRASSLPISFRKLRALAWLLLHEPAHQILSRPWEPGRLKTTPIDSANCCQLLEVSRTCDVL